MRRVCSCVRVLYQKTFRTPFQAKEEHANMQSVPALTTTEKKRQTTPATTPSMTAPKGPTNRVSHQFLFQLNLTVCS